MCQHPFNPHYHSGVLVLLPVCSPARPAKQALTVAGTRLFTESAAMKVSKAGVSLCTALGQTAETRQFTRECLLKINK